MRILALESSGLVASVAVVEGGALTAQTIAEYTVNYKKTHSQTLLPMLDEVARMTELDLNSIDAIAVAAGPGSFTGLRIGSATAKGLALALDKPLISIPTLEGLAYNLCGADPIVCPIMDARRGQVYTGIYEFDNDRLIVLEDQMAVGIEELGERLLSYDRKIVFLGDGVPVFKEALTERIMAGRKIAFAPAHLNRQRAAAVGALALRYYREGKVETAAEHQPDYLRVSQAERERKERYETLTVRTAKEQELEEIARLEQQIFPDPWNLKALRDTWSQKQARILGAWLDGQMAGYAIAYFAADESEIARIAVDQKFRRQGVAGGMLDEMEHILIGKGVAKLMLDVRKSNTAALGFYVSRGFKEDGIRKNFYTDPAEDAILMSRGLGR